MSVRPSIAQNTRGMSESSVGMNRAYTKYKRSTARTACYNYKNLDLYGEPV